MPEYTTKDSGQRAVFSTGMHRDTNVGKARFNLMFPKGVPYHEQMITRLAELYGRGAVKYAARNWEQARTAEELERFEESAARHFAQWIAGETDEDHAAAVMFNIIGAEFVKYHLRQAEAGPTRLPDGSGFFVAEVETAGPGEDPEQEAYEAILEAAEEEQRRSAALSGYPRLMERGPVVEVPVDQLRVDKLTGQVYYFRPLPDDEPPQPLETITLEVTPIDLGEGQG